MFNVAVAQPYPGYGLAPYRYRRQRTYRNYLSRQVQQYVPLADRYDTLRVLGCGGEGTVVLARPRNRGELRVMKIVKHSSPLEPPREAYILNTLGVHRNIVKMYEVEHDRASMSAVLSLEHASGGDLSGLVERWYRMRMQAPVPVVLHAMVQIGEALAYVHGNWVRSSHNSGYRLASSGHTAVVHSDLKPGNILIRPKGYEHGLPDFVLADFGMSFRPTYESRRSQGTPGYFAPEHYSQSELTTKVDIYAYGITMLWLCQGYRAELFHCGSNPGRIMIPYYLQGLGITRLLQTCLAPDPDQRISMNPSGALSYIEDLRERCKHLMRRTRIPSRVWGGHV